MPYFNIVAQTNEDTVVKFQNSGTLSAGSPFDTKKASACFAGFPSIVSSVIGGYAGNLSCRCREDILTVMLPGLAFCFHMLLTDIIVIYFFLLRNRWAVNGCFVTVNSR